jgi:hypothetical protein
MHRRANKRSSGAAASRHSAASTHESGPTIGKLAVFSASSYIVRAATQREKKPRAGGSEGPSKKAFVQNKPVHPDRTFRLASEVGADSLTTSESVVVR